MSFSNFTPDQIDAMTADELRAAIMELQQWAFTDALTKLPNRRALEQHLDAKWAEAKRHKSMISILFFDVNGFKQVNDSRGHDAGDDLLKQLADCLRNTPLRPYDLAARLAGDEFVVVLPDASRHGAMRVAEEIDKAALSIGISLSIGVASCVPLPHSSYEVLIDAADTEMYKAKQQRKALTQASV